MIALSRGIYRIGIVTGILWSVVAILALALFCAPHLKQSPTDWANLVWTAAAVAGAWLLGIALIGAIVFALLWIIEGFRPD